MSQGSNVRAGRAFVELGVNDAAFKRGLARNAAHLKTFGSLVTRIGAGLVGLGTAALGGLFASAKVFESMGSELHDMSVRTGVAVESLSALGYAAEQAGADLGTVEFGLRRAQNAIADADAGNKSAIATLARLGLTVEDLKKLKPDQQFAKLAEKITALKTPAEQTAAAIDLFGRSGTMLLPMMHGLNTQLDRAKRLGIVISSEDAKLADDFGDALGEVWKQAKMLTFHVGAAVADAMLPYAEIVTGVFSKTLEWLNANRGLVVTVGAVAGAIVGAGVALVGAGLGIKLLGVGLAGLLSVGTLVKAVFLGIVSPLGLVGVAVAGLGVYLAHTTKIGEIAINWLADRFKDLKDDALQAFEGIRAAMASNEWGTAAGVMWAALKLEWTKGAGALLGVWTDLKFGVLRVMEDLWTGVARIHENSVHLMAQGLSTVQQRAERAGSNMKRDWEKAQVTAIAAGKMLKVTEPGSDLTPDQRKQKLKEIEEGLKVELDLIDAKFDQQLTKVDREHEQRLEGLNRTHEQAIEDIANKEIEAKRNLGSQQKAAEINAQLALDKARKEFTDAVNEATDATNRQTEGPARKKAPRLPELPDIEDLLAKTKRKFSVSGTFSGFRPTGAASAVLDRIAKHTKDTADALRRRGAGGPVFT